MITIFWSETAKLDYWDNIDYLQKEWTLTDVYNFMDEVDDLLNKLSQNNLTFKATLYKNTFEVPVVKQVNLFYDFDVNSIILLRFWSNYQDRKKLFL